MKRIDLTGMRFGKLTVVKISEKKIGASVAWECACDCGGSLITRGSSLRGGLTKSCGCICRSVKGAAMDRTSAYMTWGSMLSRCKNKNSHAFERYGGRGITVDSRWMSFNNFLEDMGEPPAGMTLDRIDNNAGYSKDNCRWTDAKTQARNRENNRLVEYQGVKKPIIWWSDVVGWPHHVIASRLRIGWNDLRSLTTPRRWTDECENTILSKLNRAVDEQRPEA